MGIEDWLKRNFFYSQLGRPSGWRGKVIGPLMTAYNAEAHDFTIVQAAIGPEDRVLEIGFGGGALAERR